MDIEDIGSIIALVVFALIALFRKFSEQKEIEQEQKNQRKQAPQPLPDATRRMLYGDDAPVARPRAEPRAGEQGPVVAKPKGTLNVPTAQPRRVVPPPEAPKQVQPRPAQPVPYPAQRPVPSPRPQEVQTGTPLRPAQEQRRVAPEPQRHVASEEQRRPAPEQRRPAPPPVVHGRPQQRRKTPPPILTEEREGPAPARQPIQQGPAMQPKRRSSQKRRMFADTRELQRAIILREVLGPPKAFE